MDTELEFKFAVERKSAFLQLLKHLGLPGLGDYERIHQINHFFDTPDHLLHANHMVLRLREESGQQLLTFKCARRDLFEDGCATQCTEIEVALSPKESLDLLQGKNSPLAALEERVSGDNLRGIEPLQKLLGETPLVYIGYFKNKRIRLEGVQLTVIDETISLCIELDQSSFGPAEHDFEIEVELKSDKNLGAIHKALTGLLANAGIAWHRVESKSQRFYAKLNPNA